MSMKRGAALALVLGISGCAAPPAGPYPVTCYRAPGIDLISVRRVVVLPFERESSDAESLETLESTFAAELQKIQKFEVVSIPSTDAAIASGAIRTGGSFARGALLDIFARYRVDGALLGTVTQFHPYEPMVLGLKADLISVRTGEVVWSAEALFDAAEERTIEEIRRYHESYGGREEMPFSWRVYTQSVRAFSRFVCNRIAATIDCGVEVRGRPSG